MEKEDLFFVDVDEYRRWDFYERIVSENPVRTVRRCLISLIDRGEAVELRVRESENSGYHGVTVSRGVLEVLGTIACGFPPEETVSALRARIAELEKTLQEIGTAVSQGAPLETQSEEEVPPSSPKEDVPF